MFAKQDKPKGRGTNPNHTPTHGLDNTSRMRTAISPGRWQPDSFKCQLHTTHVGAVVREPHGSSPTACAGKADQELP